MNWVKYLIIAISIFLMSADPCQANIFGDLKNSITEGFAEITDLGEGQFDISVVAPLSGNRGDTYKKWNSSAAEACGGRDYETLERRFDKTDWLTLDGIVQCKQTNTANNNTEDRVNDTSGDTASVQLNSNPTNVVKTSANHTSTIGDLKNVVTDGAVEVTDLGGGQFDISVVAPLSRNRAATFKKWKNSAAKVCGGGSYTTLERQFDRNDWLTLDGIIQCKQNKTVETVHTTEEIKTGDLTQMSWRWFRTSS